MKYKQLLLLLYLTQKNIVLDTEEGTIYAYAYHRRTKHELYCPLLLIYL